MTVRGRVGAGLAALGVLFAGAASAHGAAYDPMVAIPPSGTAHVGWLGNDGSTNVVASRTFARSGALGAAHWISPLGERVYPADIAAGAAGNAMVAWKRDQADYAVLARPIAANGTPGVMQRISGTDTGTAQSQVAVAPDGTAVFTWMADSPNGTVVRARRRSPSGVLGPILTLSADGYRVFGTEAVFDSAGNAFVVWRRWTRVSGTPDQDLPAIVQTRRISAAGALGAVETVSSEAGAAGVPKLGADANGNVVFAWLDSRPKIRRRAADGTYSPVQSTEVEADSVQDLELAVAPGGGAVMAWGRTLRSDVTVQARHRASGGALGRVLDVSARSTGPLTVMPRVAMDRYGNALIAWRRVDGPHSRIESRYRRNDGALLPVRDQSGDGQATTPRIAFDRYSGAVLVWAAGFTNSEIYGRRKTPAGVWGDVVPFSAGATPAPSS